MTVISFFFSLFKLDANEKKKIIIKICKFIFFNGFIPSKNLLLIKNKLKKKKNHY